MACDYASPLAKKQSIIHAHRSQNEEVMKFQMIKELKTFFSRITLYDSMSSLVLGWLKPRLDYVDDIRLSIWNKCYNMDASARTIPHKFAPKNADNSTAKLNATDSHCIESYGYLIGYTRYLEKGGEKYNVVIRDQLCQRICRNMQLVKDYDEFDIRLSIDTGTEANVDNIRNCLVEGFSKWLPIESTDTTYTNQHNVKFDFKDLKIIVCITLYINVNIFTIY